MNRTSRTLPLFLLLAACGAESAATGPTRETEPRDTGSRREVAESDASGEPSEEVGPETGEDASDGESDAPADVPTDVAPGDIDATDTPPDLAEVDTTPPPAGIVGGVVWAPGNAPGMAAPGEEIPIAGALVYVTATRPSAIPQEAYCQECGRPPNSVLTDAVGAFSIPTAPVGLNWLVIEKGQFRLEREIIIEADRALELEATLTTLPSRNAPDEGDTTPRIALASGGYDHLEDILGKMSLGSINSGNTYVPESADGFIDVYDNGGALSGVAAGSLGELVNDLDRMLQYHIIFIPCAGDGYTTELYDQRVLQNIRDYVAAGGNLYVTDWSGEWHDNVFPAHVELDSGFDPFGGGGYDTPASAYNAASGTWDTSEFGNADGEAYDSPNAEVVEPSMRAWLDAQRGPTVANDRATDYDATHFEVEGSWNTITAVHEVQVGTDRDGDPIFDTPIVWVRGGKDLAPNPKYALTVTYEPVGCGRVLYSTYHTADSVHRGLVPQERILLYLIMEIGTCRNPKE